MLQSRFTGPTESSRLSRTIAALTSAPFVAAVALLLLNDWVLKDAFGNWITGKLSDVAGLAALSMFAGALFAGHMRAVFVGTAAAFVLWKSPLSDGALEAWNSLGFWSLARVKDYSDLLALGMLVPTYRLMRQMDEKDLPPQGSFVRGIGAIAVGLTAIIAFTATSVRRSTPIETTAYPVLSSRDDVLAGLDSIGVPISQRPKNRSSSAADTLVVQFRHPPERWVSLTIEIIDARPGEAQIRPIALWPSAPFTPTIELLMRAFNAQIVEPLQEWLARRREP